MSRCESHLPKNDLGPNFDDSNYPDQCVVRRGLSNSDLSDNSMAMTTQQSRVTLREVDEENAKVICDLSVHNDQRSYVVNNTVALAEAADTDNDWPLAIYADETPVGLMVLRIPFNQSDYFLWRLMIDQEYQGWGFAYRAMSLVIDRAKADSHCGAFLTSVVDGDLSPQGFYEKLGFRLTGERYQGEAVMKLKL